VTERFSKTEATRRVRQVLQAEQWVTAGRRVEVSELSGWTVSLTKITPEMCSHNAEFRVLLSTVGTWGELRDQFRMNIGNPDTPAFLVTQ